jgi:rifampicin phosphotransferase
VRFIVASDTSEMSEELGGKARALVELVRAEFNVPPFFVVLPEAVDAEKEIRKELEDCLSRLRGERFAVRSSGRGEDSAEHSFAGQFESFLGVGRAEVPARIRDVWRSAKSERVVAYRKERGIREAVKIPAVIVQEMVEADCAGVAFGVDPVSGRQGIAIVSAVRGTAEKLVSGELDADTWHVERSGKATRLNSAHAVLDTPGARRVADLARRCGEHFGRPQDIEWARAGGELFLLQSRPITTLTGLGDPEGTWNLWDNSNIAESYNGVTTPLTFSFARYVYEEVYRQFCRLMGVSEERIAAHRTVFARMLGLIRGCVYYNLLNWYRVLALLPGYAVNRRFMEQMMGVKESLPADALRSIEHSSSGERLRDAVNLGRTIVRLIAAHWRISSSIASFYSRLNDALRPPDPPLSQLRPDELVAEYRELERRLLTRWDAPLVNDFLAMIFFGVSRKLSAAWCGDPHGTLQNDLISGDGGMISAEPARRVREMAALALTDESLVEALCEAEAGEARASLGRVKGLDRAFDEYLSRFGDRCLEELKLESATLHDDPTSLLRAVGHYARRIQRKEIPIASHEGVREAAEIRGRTTLTNPFKRVLFFWLVRHTRARVRDRENLRFERTRLFGRVRRLFVELGRRFHGAQLLADPRDIFHLTVEEALGFVEGTSAFADLKAVAAARKAEFERYREMPAPPDRFETRGAVGAAPFLERCVADTPANAGNSRSGIGCCPGRVRGRARIILDPRGALLEPGEILVAQRTDPGWIMLFPAASGLLVEYGSLLSHSAIVARELGIPAVVSVTGLTEWLADGDEVEFDGSTGLIRKL